MWKSFLNTLVTFTGIVALSSCSQKLVQQGFCDGYAEGLDLAGFPPESCPDKRKSNTYEYGLLLSLEKTREPNPFAAISRSPIISGQDDPLYQTIRQYAELTLGLDLDTMSVYDVNEVRAVYTGYIAKFETDMIMEGLTDFERETVMTALKAKLPDASLLINRRRMYIISMMQAHGRSLDDLCKLGHSLCVKQIPKLIFNGRVCSRDCSGHIAGYEWAKNRLNSGNLVDEDDCIKGKSESFNEGCYSFFDQ